MKKITACLFLFINAFAINTLTAQKNYIKGVIVTNNNDTVHGTINYHNWDENPSAIQFVKEGTTEVISYKPMQIKAFTVATDYYESATVDIDATSQRLEDLGNSIEPLMIKDTVFFSVYVKGEASLYYYKSKNDRKHFFIKKNNITEELINNYYYKHLDDQELLVKSDKYKQQLINHLADCSGITEDITTLNYRGNELLKLFIKYNKCRNTSVVFIKKSDNFIFEPFIIAGASITKLNFFTTPDYLGDVVFNRSTNFALGLALNIVLPRKSKTASLYNELLYKTYQMEAFRGTKYYDINYSNTKKYVFNFTYLKLTTLLRFTYPGKKLNPFFNIGMTNAYAIRSVNTLTIETQIYNSHYSETKPAIDDIKKYEAGIAIGIGILYKHISLDCRYERGNSMAKASDQVRCVTDNYYVLLGYRF